MKFSIITLVNNPKMYEDNIVSAFKDKAELIPIYNPKTATSGLNEGVIKSTGDILVLCHQDVVFPSNWLSIVESQISKIKDSTWGVAGTYGFNKDGKSRGNVKSGQFKHLKRNLNLPDLVISLDEHCLIIRKDSGLTFDETNEEFHVYGADICMTAYTMGFKCYAIDALVHHLHDNTERNESFQKAVTWFTEKWKDNTFIKRFYSTCFNVTWD